MLSLSVYEKVGKPMSGGFRQLDVRQEAIAFIGQLRQNEAQLEERAKTLAKTDRHLAKLTFSEIVDGWTPFHAFVLRGARKLVKIALKVGVDPNLPMGQPEGLPGRCSPLHLASHRGDISLIVLLTSKHGDVNRVDDAGKRPIHYAAQAGNSLAIKKLLKLGASISDLTLEQRQYFRDDKEEIRTRKLLCVPSSSRDRHYTM